MFFTETYKIHNIKHKNSTEIAIEVNETYKILCLIPPYNPCHPN